MNTAFRRIAPILACLAVIAAVASPASAASLRSVRHIVVIYEENHSFDNLYGSWEGVNGLSKATAAHTAQVGQDGTRLTCLPQVDVNLTSPPLPVKCGGTLGSGDLFESDFLNRPFGIETFIPATAKTCPGPDDDAEEGLVEGKGAPGGCTADLVHRYYEEQYQIHGGRQDRYATGSDAAGLTMGYYNTRKLPAYVYLHKKGHPRYAILDRFFQGAFGGSFLNHQWLIAARTPVWKDAPNDAGAADLHSIVDANGMPANSPLYKSPEPAVKDAQMTASCTPPAGRPPTPKGIKCGDFAVNTTQPPYQPFSAGTAPAKQLPPLTTPTIGSRLSAKGVGWAWYSGGWSNADGRVGGPGWTNGTAAQPPNDKSTAPCPNPYAVKTDIWPHCPDVLFQYHHQPFNYYKSLAPGTAARRAHLRDEQEFITKAKSRKSCALKAVSFVKPDGRENEHPGYASQSAGDNHLVTLLKSVESGACAKSTMVIVTYDEFGGQWDHVSPPGTGSTKGPHDVWGPGTRIPALVVSPLLRRGFVVDHTEHDTTSILATIEHRFGLKPLGSRDRTVPDLASALRAG